MESNIFNLFAASDSSGLTVIKSKETEVTWVVVYLKSVISM